MFSEIIESRNVDFSEVDGVRAFVGDTALDFRMDDSRVQSFVDGQFSIPYLLAVLATGVRRGAEWHSEHSRSDPTIKAFAQRVAVIREAVPEPESTLLEGTEGAHGRTS